MRMKDLLIGTVLMLTLATWAAAAKGGKGGSGGGKPSSSTYSVIFDIEDGYDLVGDGASFVDTVDGVSAEIVGSGNPLLKLGNSVRFAAIDLAGCVVSEQETANLLSDYYVDGIVPIQGISPYGMSIDGNFLGLVPGETAYSLLGIGLEDPADNRPWSIRFDPVDPFSADEARVQRVTQSKWLVDTTYCAGGCRAAIVRPSLSKKRGGGKVVVGTCSDLQIQYTVTCAEIDPLTGECLPK